MSSLPIVDGDVGDRLAPRIGPLGVTVSVFPSGDTAELSVETIWPAFLWVIVPPELVP